MIGKGIFTELGNPQKKKKKQENVTKSDTLKENNFLKVFFKGYNQIRSEIIK